MFLLLNLFGKFNLIYFLYGIGLSLTLRALTKDNKQDTEKEQALKLVRSLVDWSTLINIPKGVIMSVVAIADSADDKFKTIALETLCEILMRNPSSASSALAIRPIFNSLLNGPVVMVDIAVCSILNVVDNPKSRIHICPRSDLPVTHSSSKL
jgi:rapamycin-insensitive companion of mTOR